MIVAVEVGAALSRPPRLDRLSRVLVEVPAADLALGAAERAACLVACDMVGSRPGVAMVVSATVVDIVEL